MGITMDAGPLTVIYGQSCGPVTCRALPGGTMGPSARRNVTVYAAPSQPFALAIGLPARGCLTIPGIANPFGLGVPLVVLAAGTTRGQLTGLRCYQGTARVPIGSYSGLPSGIVFRLQAFGISQVSPKGPSIPAFSPMLDVRVP